MSRRRALVYVQHLLGIGHLKRAAALARAMVEESLEVTLVSGGHPVDHLPLDGVRFVQLPPARALDERFQDIVDEHGQAIDEGWRAHRRKVLLEAWRAFDPHAIVTELFPFGRRQMRFELHPWLEAARAAANRPVIVSSVRDLLGGGQRDPSRQDEMLATFNRCFDQLLVHGDPKVLGFERTFRHAAALGERLHYTGYVVDRAPLPAAPSRAGEGEVIVSAGGGAVGERLLEIAIRCRELSAVADHPWRVLTGVNLNSASWARLKALANGIGCGRVVIERTRSDFPLLLQNASLSISQAGYNTCVELLDTCARAVLVPFAGGGETEQTLRARAFAERGWVECVEDDSLTPATLAAAVDRAASRPRRASGVNLEGARRSARLVAGWAEGIRW